MDLNGRQHIGGAWRAGAGEAMTSQNPATGETLWAGQAASRDQVHEAIAAARSVTDLWRDTPLTEREAILRRYAEVVTARKAELTALIRDEGGKPTWDAASEAGALAAKVGVTIDEWHRRLAERRFDNNGVTARLTYEPLGVLAVLGPFNFPTHLPNGHLVPALLTGNTIVFKPSELTPACGELLVRCYEEAGLPAGVLNLVQGGREVGEALADGEINGLLFTGGVPTGLALHRKFAEKPDKMLALELGGNNPLVVHSLGDVDNAIEHVIQSAYVSAGQRCTCARRLIVTDAAPAEFIDQLVAAIREIKVGLPNAEPSPFMGPLITSEAARRVLEAQRDLIARGAMALVEVVDAAMEVAGSGSDPKDSDSDPNPRLPSRRHSFLRPGLLDVTDIEREDAEIFGPILQLVRVPDLDAAIIEANNTRYGLAAGILTDDRPAYDRFRRHVRAGLINWNRPLTGASGKLPFGGVGLSGNFRPSGSAALDYCTHALASLEESPRRHGDTE